MYTFMLCKPMGQAPTYTTFTALQCLREKAEASLPQLLHCQVTIAAAHLQAYAFERPYSHFFQTHPHLQRGVKQADPY